MQTTRTQCWRQVILPFTSQASPQNPFLDLCIQAEFTGPAGQCIPREAYWDGGNNYKVAFAPTAPGLWHYRLAAPEETGLNGVTGAVECVPYTGALPIYRHGFLQVSPDGRYLMHADGTPFFWLGDTHWEFAYNERWDQSNHPAMTSMFKGMADRRAAQGYNVYQTNLRSDAIMGNDARYWDKTSPTDLPNVAFYQTELDRRMQYLADLGFVNALGQAWFMSMDRTPQSVAHQKNLARYLVARYGALPICWTLAGETGGYDLGEPRAYYVDAWRQVALTIEALDGYHNLQTAHYTNERPFAGYYQNESWFDFTLNQAGHGDYPINAACYREHRQAYPGKPFIEGEALYEFCSTLEELGPRQCTADMLRRVAYISIQTGGCGYTYGAQGIWDCVWEKGGANAMALFNRFDVTWAQAIDGPGARQMRWMKQFYTENHFEQMYPYGAQQGPASVSPFSKKQPLATVSASRQRVILYYDDAARKSCVLQGLVDRPYTARWFDPRTGAYTTADAFTPEQGRWTTPPKPGLGDWLLVAEAL